jgi:CheY-like chemotaxis protein
MTITKTFRLLLVEDDSGIAQLIAMAMHDLDLPFQLDQVLSAEEALELWAQQPYDLLLTDYNLRGMNGLTLVTTLKAQHEIAPMVLFTAYDTPQLRRAARNAGVAEFIAKPFFFDQFIDLTRNLLPIKTTALGAPPSA